MKNSIFDKTRSVLHNNDAKTLMENFISLSMLKVVSFIIPFITLPYLSRVIGADGFGAIAFASAIMVFVETITDWGFNYTATRDVAKNRTDISYVCRIYSEIMVAKTIIMIVCFIAIYVATIYVESLREYRLLLILTFCYIPGHIIFPEWLFQAFEKMKYITILNVLSKLIFTVLIFFVVKNKEDYIYQPLLTALGFIVSGIIAQYIIIRQFRIHFYFPPLLNVWLRLKGSTNMFICLILPNLYTNFTTIILKSFGGDAATGIYSAGQKFQQLADQLSQVLSRTFFPFLARHNEKHHVYVKISGAISVATSLFLFFGADLLVRTFYTEEFAPAATVIRIFSATPFFLFLMNTYGTNYLVIIGKENILRNIITICSLFGFLLTWMITPYFGYIGAVSTITVVWGIRGIATYCAAKKIKIQND